MQTKKRVLGSMKNKIVATDLIEERAKCNFDQNELAMICFPPGPGRDTFMKALKDIEEDPKL